MYDNPLAPRKKSLADYIIKAACVSMAIGKTKLLITARTATHIKAPGRILRPGFLQA